MATSLTGRLRPAHIIVIVLVAASAVAYASARISAQAEPGAQAIGQAVVAPAAAERADPRAEREAHQRLILGEHRAHLKRVARERHLAWVEQQQVRKAAAQEAVQEARAIYDGRVPDWDGVAACESGGDWSINTGNGYWGGLQFAPTTWFAFGGGPFDGVGSFPYSKAEQIAVAERTLAGQGPGAWPVCFRWA